MFNIYIINYTMANEIKESRLKHITVLKDRKLKLKT